MNAPINLPQRSLDSTSWPNTHAIVTPHVLLSQDELDKLYPNLPGLGMFRVLELFAGSRDVPLEGKLLPPMVLVKTKGHHVLSYRWSELDPNKPLNIKIDGIQFPIGANLHAALVELRHPLADFHVWIDQICINQGDGREKRGQLGIMGNIYSCADYVHIWLGEGNQQTDIAMEFFPVLVDRVKRDCETARVRGLEAIDTDIVPFFGSIAACLNSLFSRDWFERVWTLQEYALAKNGEVRCGSKQFHIQVLEDFRMGCDNDQYGLWGRVLEMISSGAGPVNPTILPRPLNFHVNTVSLAKAKSTISNARLLNSLRAFDCSYHTDRIYAIGHFISSALQEKVLEPSAPSAEQLYRIVAVHELQRGELNHLCAAGLAQHRISYTEEDLGQYSTRPRYELPSWVPDWTCPVRVRSFWVYNDEHLRNHDEALFTAGGPRLVESKCAFSAQTKVLSVQAIIFDEVEKCTDALASPIVSEDDAAQTCGLIYAHGLIEPCLRFMSACRALAVDGITSEDSSDRAYRRTLVGGLAPQASDGSRFTAVYGRISDGALDDLYDNFESMLDVQDELDEECRRMDAGELPPRTEIPDLIDGRNRRMAIMEAGCKLIMALRQMCRFRRFFRTVSKRYIGIGPDVVVPGDKLCVIPGCPTPFAIRPKGNCYQLVGECYIDGIMDGELVKDKDQTLKIISFV